MNVVNIFEDMSDPIVVVNASGIVTYSNKTARSIRIVNRHEMIRSREVNECLRKALDKEVKTPVKMLLRDDLGVDGEFKLTIDKLCESSFIIHFKDISGQSQTGILKKNLMVMLRDELERPLTKLFASTDELIDTIKNVEESAENRALLDQALEDGSALMNSVWRIKLVTDLYTNKEMRTNEHVLPKQIMDFALHQLAIEINEKQLSINVNAKRMEPVNFIGNKFWLALAFKECLYDVIRHCKEKDLIDITIHLHGYFLTIKIDNKPPSDNGNRYEESTDYDRALFQNINNALMFDLFLAARVIELHGGHIKSKVDNDIKSIVIELPLGRALNTPESNGLDQAKLYAKDLAKLRMIHSSNKE
jgi:hypothetical protein